MAVTGEVIGSEKANDLHQNMIIWVCFKHNDIELPFYKDGQLLMFDGKQVWPLYCRFENFVNKTEEEIVAWVKANVEHQIDNLITAIAKPIINIDLEKTLPAKITGEIFSKDYTVIEGTTIRIYPDGTVV